MKLPVIPKVSNLGKVKSISLRILAMKVVVNIKNWTNIAIHYEMKIAGSYSIFTASVFHSDRDYSLFTEAS
jgi:hypothetical protein